DIVDYRTQLGASLIDRDHQSESATSQVVCYREAAAHLIPAVKREVSQSFERRPTLPRLISLLEIRNVHPPNARGILQNLSYDRALGFPIARKLALDQRDGAVRADTDQIDGVPADGEFAAVNDGW